MTDTTDTGKRARERLPTNAATWGVFRHHPDKTITVLWVGKARDKSDARTRARKGGKTLLPHDVVRNVTGLTERERAALKLYRDRVRLHPIAIERRLHEMMRLAAAIRNMTLAEWRLEAYTSLVREYVEGRDTVDAEK